MTPMPVLPPDRRATLARALGIALQKRAEVVADYPDWEAMRQRGHDIRATAIERLDELLAQFERNAIANGCRVVRVATAGEACRYVVGLAHRLGVKTAVKAKSMVSEEIHLNHALEKAGVQPFETDLGEYIAQLSGQPPSHITGPVVHLSRDEIGRILCTHLGVPFSNDPVQLTTLARNRLRREFLTARLGISGANFLVAETGSVVLVTNEGNGRLCTTLPSTENPRVHVVVTGLEKVVPTLKDAAHLLRLLGRSATGQRLTVYTTFIQGPRDRSRRREEAENGVREEPPPPHVGGYAVEPTGPDEVHIVLLDNGRRAMRSDPHLREALSCIRCGACSNICPVYNRISGHGYQSVYNGPIGSIWSPALWDNEQNARLPFASSLCGACTDICPVKVPIHHVLLWQRNLMTLHGYVPQWQRWIWRAWFWGMNSAWLYRFGSRAARLFVNVFGTGLLNRAAKPWTGSRELPPLAQKTFRQLWKESEPS